MEGVEKAVWKCVALPNVAILCIVTTIFYVMYLLLGRPIIYRVMVSK